jgi:hypothetical protein
VSSALAEVGRREGRAEESRESSGSTAAAALAETEGIEKTGKGKQLTRSAFCVVGIKCGLGLNSESPHPEQPSGLKPELLPGKLHGRWGMVSWHILLETPNFVVTGHRLAGA